MSSGKNNDPVSIFVSERNKAKYNFILDPNINKLTTSTYPIMNVNRVHPLIERLNAIINSCYPTASPSSNSDGKKCGELHSSDPLEEKVSGRPIDVNTGIIDCNGMSDFECEDFSLDSLDSIFDESPILSNKDMNSSSTAQTNYPDSMNTSPPISNSSYSETTKDDIKGDFNLFPLPNPLTSKHSIQDNYNINQPLFHHQERNCSSDSINYHSNHSNTIHHNNSFGFNNSAANNVMTDNIFELQPPFPMDNFQSPVGDMPGFEWCSTLDWNENTSYDNTIVPSLPYSAYHTHHTNTSADCSDSPAPTTPLGPMPPLELINPSHSHEEKFSCSNYSQDMSHLSAASHDLTGDLNVLGVHLNNLMQGTNNSSDANSRLLTDLTKSSLPLNDNHFTPPPSPNTDSKVFQRLSPPNIVTEHKQPRKRIVISKYSSSNTSPRKNKKIVIPREIKANHMDCHDYTNKVQYTKVISSIPKVTSQSFPTNSSRNEIRQLSNYTTQSSPINISLAHKNSFQKDCGITTRVEDIRRKISEMDDPEYLAHGTGIPR